jgi:hypothetical protein
MNADKVLDEVKERRTLRLKQLEEAESQLKNTKQRLADRDLKLAEAKRLLAENEKFEVEMRRRQDEELKRKPGAKWKWKGEIGYHLICAVKALTTDGTKNDAQAFHELHSWAKFWRSNRKATEAQARFEQLIGEHWLYLRNECSEQKPRQLAARYYDALQAWGPYFKRDAALNAKMGKLV